MLRNTLGIAFSLALLAVWPAAADVVSLDEALSEKVLGDPNAPVTMVEYSSLGCPHCANFHKDTLPKIKEAYIDTGKVKLVYRDFPLGAPALGAAMIARCSGNDRFFGFQKVLFRSQKTWAGAQNPFAELTKIARMGGLSPDDVNACLKNEALMTAIQDRAREAQVKQNIDSTPTFIVGDERIPGALDFKDFAKVLDAAIADAQ